MTVQYAETLDEPVGRAEPPLRVCYYMFFPGGGIGRYTDELAKTVGRTPGAEPLYVVRLEPETDRVVVGPAATLERSRLTLDRVNWLDDAPLPTNGGKRLSVKLRSSAPLAGATVRTLSDCAAEVALDAPQLGVAPGQACVFYEGDRVLGGGWIRRTA